MVKCKTCGQSNSDFTVLCNWCGAGQAGKSDAEELKKYKEFVNSVACLLSEGVEFMTKSEIYDAIKKDYQEKFQKGE